MVQLNEDQLETALSQLESATFNFAYRYINDGNVRQSYINQTKKLSQEYRLKVSSGTISASDAARQVNQLRNEILEVSRLRSSDIGKAKTVSLKKTGLTLETLTEKYSLRQFNKPFEQLSSFEQNKVYLEIIESSGRSRPSVNAAAIRYSRLGRGLLIVTLGVSVYNIATAEDKLEATTKEGVVLGGGFAGGALGGATAGLICGPGAPVCVTIGAFIGGALGALGADMTFGWYFE
ncbi:hypothetical protein [Vibrio spartinae]|uniref:Uncharacterized protein n=1 Tax=Vibrio spartinae TaxID=1918945 RepID=A0A1N6M9W4_9VIBR|nr:hypothetical protein [Vibrio spartinae]SIO96224.1 hypothetical protein VSP9026_04006 [Vibrio spartinae]